MIKISAPKSVRWIMLILVCGFAAIPFVFGAGSFLIGKDIARSALIGSIIPLIVACWAMWLYSSKKADEVFDNGDSLHIVKSSVREKVSLKDIAKVKYQYISPPFLPYIQISLRTAGKFGSEIYFFVSQPGFRGEHPIAVALQSRIDGSNVRSSN